MKKFWQNFKLKMALFRIWLLKNIFLFLEIALIVLVVLILTGVVTPDTPVLNKIPLIGGDDGLIVSIHKLLDGTQDISSVFGVILSVFLTIGMFMLKVRNISQADIKSDRLKLALINAHLYFNRDGRLVKKMEKASGQDVNGDGKIDEEEDTKPYRGVFSRAISATKELVLILSTDFSADENENKEKYEKVLVDGDLKDAAEADDEIRKNIIPDGKAALEAAKVEEVTDKVAEAVMNDQVSTNDEKRMKVSFIKRFGTWFNTKRENGRQERKRKKEEKAAKKEADRIAKLEKKALKEENKKSKEENIATPKAEEVKTETLTTNEKAVNNFISSISKKH